MSIIRFQIGKQGLTEGFIQTLENCFKKNKGAKIYVLKSGRPEGKIQVKKYEEEILKRLGKNYVSRAIGFTINIKKWRRPVR